MTKQELKDHLVRVLDEIQYNISHIRREFGSNATAMRTPDGRYILLDALVAEANVLSALALLESQEAVKA